MIGWFRRRPTRAQLRAEVELWQARCREHEARRDEAYVRAKAAEKLLRQIRREVIDRLNEPPAVDGCRKIRFHRRPGAEDWAAAVARDCEEDPAAYHTYQCKVCPRSPVTTGRYWHIGHVDQALKADGEKARRAKQAASRRDGRLLEQRIDPTILAQLRRSSKAES